MKIECKSCSYSGDPEEFKWDRYKNKYKRVVIKSICPICKKRFEKVLNKK